MWLLQEADQLKSGNALLTNSLRSEKLGKIAQNRNVVL